MKAPDARQSYLIRECGCDPSRYIIASEKNGWIHALDKDKNIVTHFDLERKMPCYSEDVMKHMEDRDD